MFTQWSRPAQAQNTTVRPHAAGELFAFMGN